MVQNIVDETSADWQRFIARAPKWDDLPDEQKTSMLSYMGHRSNDEIPFRECVCTMDTPALNRQVTETADNGGVGMTLVETKFGYHILPYQVKWDREYEEIPSIITGSLYLPKSWIEKIITGEGYTYGEEDERRKGASVIVAFKKNNLYMHLNRGLKLFRPFSPVTRLISDVCNSGVVYDVAIDEQGNRYAMVENKVIMADEASKKVHREDDVYRLLYTQKETTAAVDLEVVHEDDSIETVYAMKKVLRLILA